MLEWQCSTFDKLSTLALYELLKIRQEVFIIEQTCIYPDIDDVDQQCHHLLGWSTQADKAQLMAYARLVPPGKRYPEPSIGRVLTIESARGSGAGKELMKQSIAQIKQLYPSQGIRISAQLYLKTFYEGFGFSPVSEPYLEDDIPHIEMLNL